MSNKRDIEPSLDYFELRRRHEEYKNSQRQVKPQPAAEAAEDAEATQSSPEALPVETARPEPVAVEPEDVDIDAAPVAGDAADAGGALPVRDELPEDDFVEESFDDDFDDAADVGSDADNPNPFDSFIHAFKGIRGRLSGRFGRGKADEVYDDEYEDDFDEMMMIDDDEFDMDFMNMGPVYDSDDVGSAG